MEEKKQFYIGVVAEERWQELVLAVLPDLEDRLNERIDLRAYPGELEEVYVTFLIAPEEEPERESWWFEDEERKLFLEVWVEPELEASLNEEQFGALVSRSLLDQLAKVDGMPADLIEALGSDLDDPKEEDSTFEEE